MDSPQTVELLVHMIFYLIGAIGILVGWVGNRIFARLDKTNDFIQALHSSTSRNVGGLRDRIARLEAMIKV